MSICITLSGAEAIDTQSPPDWYGPSELSFFALDDMGCSGSESNLLHCLPDSNCDQERRGTENAGVQCLREGMDGYSYQFSVNAHKNLITLSQRAILGVKLEYGPNQESNNTLITVNGTQEVLYCSTDRKNDELNIPGSWFLPNGSKISSATTNTQSLHIAFGNQTVGLNVSPDLPSGIHHCEMMDRDNVTHHLYAGIYPEDKGMC